MCNDSAASITLELRKHILIAQFHDAPALVRLSREQVEIVRFATRYKSWKILYCMTHLMPRRERTVRLFLL